jgi:hypothetical protein
MTNIAIQNYGFTKTIGNNINNEIKWMGDYNGDVANIELDINNNGKKELIHMKLDNNDLIEMLGVQPVEMSLDERLMNDYLKHDGLKPFSSPIYQSQSDLQPLIPITLEGALIKKKSRKHRKYNKRQHKKTSHKRRKSHRR